MCAEVLKPVFINPVYEHNMLDLHGKHVEYQYAWHKCMVFQQIE